MIKLTLYQAMATLAMCALWLAAYHMDSIYWRNGFIHHASSLLLPLANMMLMVLIGLKSHRYQRQTIVGMMIWLVALLLVYAYTV